MTGDKRTRWNSTIKIDPAAPRLRRSGPPKKRNSARKGHRFPKLVDEPYREWIRSLRCVLDGKHECVGVVQCCHVKRRGCGGADRGNCYPGCAAAHDEEHRGMRTFERKYDLDLADIARELEQWYEGDQDAF